MGNFTQLDAYSRLKCHETLFSNLNSNRNLSFYFFHFSHSLQKYFADGEELVVDIFRCNLYSEPIELTTRFGYLNSYSLVLFQFRRHCCVLDMYPVYFCNFVTFSCKTSDPVA